MLPSYYVNAWYGEEVSKRSRKFLGNYITKIDSQNDLGFEQQFAVGAAMLATGGAHIPHILIGGAPYTLAMNMASKAAKASEVVELYNLSKWSKIRWSANPVNLASYWFLGSGLPSKAQAKAAAKVVRRTSRVVPVLWGAALAYDLYDIVFNRSFWGIKF